ncbi:hypothetical protein NHP190003_13570 [Helicobacter sp. NHP19-003]|uniref:AAA+ ATPase domain-containing protein n=1 Tax=Helicobacter gastrocanis TaxID=2849641 RepID=A0ABM7SEM5_9HELI|nr:AAA family ATPase [Helicobacter sp. NHP19-003]BCZ18075.1 hypothetical protein NHP190003_13570 [Helicobacter sp. NHP19-003]
MENKRDIVREVEAFIAEYNISQAQMAKSVNKSPALLSSFLRGNYKHSTDALEEDLRGFMRSYKKSAQERAKLNDLGILELENLKNAHFVISQAVICKKSALIFGSAGSGKSESLKAFARKNPQTILVEVVPQVNTKDFLMGLGERLAVDDPRGSKNIAGLILSLSKKLSERDTILMIDEAEHLSTASLEALRRLHDFTQTPIILCGTPQLLKNLKGKNGELLQLYSRISLKYEFGAPSKEDLTPSLAKRRGW